MYFPTHPQICITGISLYSLGRQPLPERSMAAFCKGVLGWAAVRCIQYPSLAFRHPFCPLLAGITSFSSWKKIVQITALPPSPSFFISGTLTQHPSLSWPPLLSGSHNSHPTQLPTHFVCPQRDVSLPSSSPHFLLLTFLLLCSQPSVTFG